MNKDYYKDYKSLRKKLGIDEWLDLCKEDKILNGGYVSFGQYIYILEQQLEEKSKIINEAIGLINHIIKELDKRDMLHPAETELLKILERSNYVKN